MPNHSLTPQLKAYVAKRANYCCEYCLSQLAYSSDPFSVDHIAPRASGGSDFAENLAYACLGCNGRKFTVTEATDPVTGEVVSIYNPRQQIWIDHFTWNDECTQIIGITPTGRATIERLKLNRTGVVNLRRLLGTIDKHPPF